MQKNVIGLLVKYITFFGLFFVLARASIQGLVFPFAFGFALALIWSGQKIYAVLPLFLIASLLTNFELSNVVGSVFFVLTLLLITGIHTKLQKPISLPFYVAYSFFSLGGYLFGKIYFDSQIIYAIITVFLAVGFMLMLKTFFAVLQQKGKLSGLSAVEIICGLVFLCAVSAGLYDICIFGVSVLKFFACLLILIFAKVSKIPNAILLGSVIGLGPLLASGTSLFVAPFIIWAVTAGAFSRSGKIFSAVSLVLVEALLGFGFSLYETYSILDLIFVGVSALIFICLPKSLFNNLSYLFIPYGELAYRSVVNRSRETLCKRLTDLSDVFGEMDYVFRSMIRGGMNQEDAQKFLVSEIKDTVCSSCPEKNICHRKCQEETNEVLELLIYSALSRGRTTLLDVPPYLTTRCKKVTNLVGEVNSLCSQYKQYSSVMQNLDASKILIADELKGVSKIMKELANEVNKNVNFDASREKQIIDNLKFCNIICADAVVWEQNTNIVSVTLVVRNTDALKKQIESVVSKVCKTQMMITEEMASQRAGFNVLTLKTAPRFSLAFGTASCKKDGSEISGDCYSVIKLSADKFLLALSDGMGSGVKAEEASSLAIGLVENFYKAGFDNDIILSSVNKLLSLNKDEVFSALDICVVSTRTGTADFIKMGAPFSIIKHNTSVCTVEGGALPLGITSTAPPCTMKKMLSSGDYVFMFTDGVADSFESDENLTNFINNLTSLNPQTLAEEIIAKALENSGTAKDDMTVIVAKIF